MEDNFCERYEEEGDLNKKYRILIRERKRLRERFHEKHGSEDKMRKMNRITRLMRSIQTNLETS